jgi:hypothetical protein
MCRILLVSATLAALSLAASQPVSAGDENSVKGTFAFTLAETCVQQASFPNPGQVVPGFDANFKILDPNGAMTYGGASDGLMVFDGSGRVSIRNAFATNIFNACGPSVPASVLVPNPGPPGWKVAPGCTSPPFLSTGSIPLGFGFGPAIPFSCSGPYSVSGAQITVNLTCTAMLKNTTNITGFTSMFNMKGVLPQNPFHLLLTDLGDQLQPVAIHVSGAPDIMVTRVCTRSTTLDRVSP